MLEGLMTLMCIVGNVHAASLASPHGMGAFCNLVVEMARELLLLPATPPSRFDSLLMICITVHISAELSTCLRLPVHDIMVIQKDTHRLPKDAEEEPEYHVAHLLKSVQFM